MKKIYIIGLGVLLFGCMKQESVVVPMYLESANQIGTVTIYPVHNGLEFLVDLNNLSAGDHGFHIHEIGNCSHKIVDGKEVLFGAAGSHYEPKKTNHHMGPDQEGHKGDLPYLTANQKGVIQALIYKKGLTLDEIKGRSLVIHQNGDNYADTPKPLGGGGERIACGVIR